jgi:hypothetical protein
MRATRLVYHAAPLIQNTQELCDEREAMPLPSPRREVILNENRRSHLGGFS